MLTPVDKFDGYWVKREDMAYWTSLEYPSGSKVRQYTEMAKATPEAPMVVGCAAHSAMQIYVAAAARQAKVPAFIFVPNRKERTSATEYALNNGAHVAFVKPGYMSVLRHKARELSKELGTVVKWNVPLAIRDAYDQFSNIPREARRIVVATGSGLTAAALLAAIHTLHPMQKLLVIATSGLADEEKIRALACSHLGVMRTRFTELPEFEIIRFPAEYGEHRIESLPDGTPLDPYYAAKAFAYVDDGDVLWTPGLRPVCSMPPDCQEAFKEWKGFGSLGT